MAKTCVVHDVERKIVRCQHLGNQFRDLFSPLIVVSEWVPAIKSSGYG